MPPELELLDWRDKVRVGPRLLHTALTCSIKHLKLYRIRFDRDLIESFKAMQRTQPSNLETLDVECMADLWTKKPKGSAFDLVSQMLKYCSPALRSLRWSDFPGEQDEIASSEPLPELSSIRDLPLHSTKTRSAADLKSMLLPSSGSMLVRLELDRPDELLMEYAGTVGSLPMLKKFAVTMGRGLQNLPISFFEANPQLELLSLDYYPLAAVEELLPLIAHRFHHLLSLEVNFDQDTAHVPEFTLEHISRLKSLEKLRIRAGNPFGWRRSWLVDHKAIRNCVQQLPELKYLALSRDTYLPAESDEYSQYEGYYDTPWRLAPRDFEERQLLRRPPCHHQQDFIADFDWKFEMIHLRRMLKQAQKYVRLRYANAGPKLEFIYFGQIPLRVKCGWYGWRPHAVSERRDDCYKFLNRLFKGREDLFDED